MQPNEMHGTMECVATAENYFCSNWLSHFELVMCGLSFPNLGYLIHSYAYNRQNSQPYAGSDHFLDYRTQIFISTFYCRDCNCIRVVNFMPKFRLLVGKKESYCINFCTGIVNPIIKTFVLVIPPPCWILDGSKVVYIFSLGPVLPHPTPNVIDLLFIEKTANFEEACIQCTKEVKWALPIKYRIFLYVCNYHTSRCTHGVKL